MELSWNSSNSADCLKITGDQKARGDSSYIFSISEDDIIDISKINFDDDESWLCTVDNNQDCVTNVEDWLHNIKDCNASLEKSSVSPRYIDSRTYTRPKKRQSRPSIEQYNELYATSEATINLNAKSYVIEEKSENEAQKPNFDLTQPSSSYYFEKLVAESEQADSFQNMSPPSLVNSMGSSMFASLMENSYIKNDPVLREIRDADYSDSVLLQDLETPMMLSIESCSSINSDSPENFLKKVSFNGTYKRNVSTDEKNITVLESYNTEFENEKDITLKNDLNSDQINETFDQNRTYNRTPKNILTFKKSDLRKGQKLLQTTYDLVPQVTTESIDTHTFIKDCGSLEDIKRDLSDPIDQNTDLNRLSYCSENEKIINTTINDVNTNKNLNSSALSGSVGSADSLDRLSSTSGSSRDSNKMINMTEVDAIVGMQERNLNQIMSTPNPRCASTKILWESNYISPIVSHEGASDSDLSSTDDYKSVKSSQSSKTSLDDFASKQPKFINTILPSNIDARLKGIQRSTYSNAPVKPLLAIRTQTQKSSSCSTVKSSNIPESNSNSNVYKLCNPKLPKSTSNLKAMGPKLKGSYTSLRPMHSNLPVAPPLVDNFNETVVKSNAEYNNVTKVLESGTRIVQVKTVSKEKALVDGTFIKPSQPKPSNLPRPSSIPRPSTSSRIPGPRTSNIRIPPRPTTCSKRLAKHQSQ